MVADIDVVETTGNWDMEMDGFADDETIEAEEVVAEAEPAEEIVTEAEPAEDRARTLFSREGSVQVPPTAPKQN